MHVHDDSLIFSSGVHHIPLSFLTNAFLFPRDEKPIVRRLIKNNGNRLTQIHMIKHLLSPVREEWVRHREEEIDIQ